MEGEAAFVADRVIAVSERLKQELCETYQLPEAPFVGAKITPDQQTNWKKPWWMVKGGAFVPLNVVDHFQLWNATNESYYNLHRLQTPCFPGDVSSLIYIISSQQLRFCIYFCCQAKVWAINNGIQCAGIQDREMKQRTDWFAHFFLDLHMFFLNLSQPLCFTEFLPGPFWWYAGRSWFCEGTLWYRMFGPCGTLCGSHGGWNERRRHLDRGSARHLGMPRWCQGDLRWRWRQQDALWPSGQRTQCGRFLPFFGSTLWRRACQFASWNYLEHSPSLSCHDYMSWSCLDEYRMFHWHLLDFVVFSTLATTILVFYPDPIHLSILSVFSGSRFLTAWWCRVDTNHLASQSVKHGQLGKWLWFLDSIWPNS